MTDAREVLERHEQEVFAAGIHESYADHMDMWARLISNLGEDAESQEWAALTRQAIRAELALVPIVRHGNCGSCLYVGILATDSTILAGSATKVSVSRTSVEGLYTDSFLPAQLGVLIRHATELEAVGLSFAVKAE